MYPICYIHNILCFGYYIFVYVNKISNPIKVSISTPFWKDIDSYVTGYVKYNLSDLWDLYAWINCDALVYCYINSTWYIFIVNLLESEIKI